MNYYSDHKCKVASLILFFYFLIGITLSASTQDFALYKKKIHTDAYGKILSYRILYPKVLEHNKKYPLILFLHGSDECGRDNEQQLIHGGQLFIEEANRTKYPCFVIFPQCPKNELWTTINKSETSRSKRLQFDYQKAPQPSLRAVISLLKEIIATEQVAKYKIYIMGLSIGGMGAFEAVYRFPDLFAGTLPICGAGNHENYGNRVKNKRFWIFHGAADDEVSVTYSRQMVDQLKKNNIEVVYSEYKGVKHNSWDNALAEPNLMNWIFDTSK